MAKRFIPAKFMRAISRDFESRFRRWYKEDLWNIPQDAGACPEWGGDLYDHAGRFCHTIQTLEALDDEHGVEIPLLDHRNLKRLLDALKQADADSEIARPSHHDAEDMSQLDGFNHRKRIESLIKLIEKTLEEV